MDLKFQHNVRIPLEIVQLNFQTFPSISVKMVVILVNLDFRTIFDIFSLRTRKQLRFSEFSFFSCEGTLKGGLKSSQRCMQLEIFVREKCVIRSIFYNFSAHFDTFLHNNLKLLEYPPICSYHIKKRIKCFKNHINFV